MKKGFYTIMSAQFFSSLADNALFVAAVELLKTSGQPEWQRAALVPMFALFYVVLAPLVGAFYTGMTRAHLSVFAAITIFGVFTATMSCMIKLWNSRNAKRHPAEVEALLAIARSDRH